MNHFSYAERLHEFRNPTIRILDILPGRDPSRSIYCRLRHTSLKTNPTYDAISYCWGELSPVAEIICNGRSLNITQNLHDALLVFRSQTHVVSVWADAICINQSDGEEKAQQIPFMWRIYQDARTVRVWLGRDEAGHAVNAFQILESFYTRAEKLAREKGIPFSELHSMSTSFFLKEGNRWLDLHRFEPEEAWELFVPSLGEFLKLKWWARVWVVQEIIFGGAGAVLYWGDAQISWNTALLAIGVAIQLVPMAQALIAGLPHETMIRIHRPLVMLKASRSHTPDQGSRPTLLALLLTFRQWTSGDARDRVFALLNLSRTPGIIQPNYSGSYSVEDAYFDTAAAILATEPGLALLAVSKSLDKPPTLNLSSWVPVWNTPFDGQIVALHFLELFNDTRQEVHFDATLASTYPKECYKISSDKRILKLKGIIMDEIVETASASSMEEWRQRLGKSEAFIILMRHVDLYRWAKVSRASRSKRYINGEPSFVALVKTLSYGQLPADVSTESIQKDLDWRVERGWLPSLLYSWGVPWSSILYRLVDWVWYWVSIILKRSLTQPIPDEDMSAINLSIQDRAVNRHLFRTRGGYVGQTTNLEIKAGKDSVALIQGCRFPLILRPATVGSARWRSAGGCYVHGMMYGERFDRTKCVDIELV